MKFQMTNFVPSGHLPQGDKFQISSKCQKGAFAFLFLTSYFLLLTSSLAQAQIATTPEFFVTWRSGAYVESGYQGKILPVAGAPITLAMNLIDGGKLANLSKTMIRWIKNDKIVQSGIGLQTVTIPTSSLTDRDEIRIKIVVSQYKGADLPHSFVLPVAAPEVVIRATYPGWLVPAGNASFRALFYHWSIAAPEQLLIRWSLQGQTIESSGGSATLAATIPEAAAGSALTLQLTTNNTVNDLESANTLAQLLIIR